MRASIVTLGFLLAAALAPAADQTFLLSGATVHTVSGETYAPGEVLVRDGKIAAVGRTVGALEVPAIQLRGQHLYPGLIALDSVLGLTEIEAVHATTDFAEVGEYTPDVESWIAVNPDSELIPVARANGIALFEPVPLGGVVSGQSGLVSVEGWTVEERVVRKPSALHLFWPSQDLDLTPKGRAAPAAKTKPLAEQAKERRTRLQAVTDFLEEARAYAKARNAATNASAAAFDRVPAWEAMLPYVRGELPIVIHADEVRQIRSAVNWAAAGQYRIVLAGARDAAQVATLLAAKKIPVIFDHTYTLPARDTLPYDVYYNTPARLHAAGVRVTFGVGLRSFEAPLVGNLPHAAAQAVAFGLPEAEALKGITLYPAQLAGVADRFGSLEPGKEATLFATDGSLLDIRSRVTRMWVAGKPVTLESRHTRLYEKYRNRPKKNDE